MEAPVQIVECPRDAWQALPRHIPTHVKADYLRKLITAGFTQIDAVSFVSPTAVPQMADSEEVLQLLGPQPSVNLLAIVVNTRGAERAIATGAIRTLGFPFSISPTFLQRNQNQSSTEALTTLKAIAAASSAANLNTIAYISMAFGNPYGDPWSIQQLVEACSSLIGSGIDQISLADTVGLTTPTQLKETLTAVFAAHPTATIGVHLHARRDQAAGKIRAAYTAGCRRFDSAIAGFGGCPFAQDDLVGNIPTENLVAELRSVGAILPNLQPLENLIKIAREISADYSAPQT